VKLCIGWCISPTTWIKTLNANALLNYVTGLPTDKVFNAFDTIVTELSCNSSYEISISLLGIYGSNLLCHLTNVSNPSGLNSSIQHADDTKSSSILKLNILIYLSAVGLILSSKLSYAIWDTNWWP